MTGRTLGPAGGHFANKQDDDNSLMSTIMIIWKLLLLLQTPAVRHNLCLNQIALPQKGNAGYYPSFHRDRQAGLHTNRRSEKHQQIPLKSERKQSEPKEIWVISEMRFPGTGSFKLWLMGTENGEENNFQEGGGVQRMCPRVKYLGGLHASKLCVAGPG